MEVAALNELLRREFAPVLKLLRAPAGATESTHKSPRANPAATASLAPSTVADSAAAPPSSAVAAATEEMTVAAGPNDPATSVSATVKPAAAAPPAADDPPQLARIDRFRQHCLAVTRRLNAYQYASASAFVQEVEQLSLVARSPEQKQALQLLSERVATLKVPDSHSERRVLGALEFDTSAGIPGLQEVSVGMLDSAASSSSSSSSSSGKKWLCNVNINEQSISIGAYLTRENALKAYDLFRFDLNTNRSGVSSVYKLADQIAAGQRESDASVLEAAVNKIHSHLAWQRLHDMMPLAPTVVEKDILAPVTVTTPSKAPQQRAAPSKAIPASPSSPGVSSAESASNTPATGGAAPKTKARKRKKPAERMSHLRLRRLIQKRLCPHLKGKEVCVVRHVRSSNLDDKMDWTPTGRLENGMVFAYKLNKQVTFADYVADVMGHTVSACPHIFLVKTRESVDDHLLVCDAFSDAERLQLGVDFTSSFQNYMNAPEHKARKR